MTQYEALHMRRCATVLTTCRQLLAAAADPCYLQQALLVAGSVHAGRCLTPCARLAAVGAAMRRSFARRGVIAVGTAPPEVRCVLQVGRSLKHHRACAASQRRSRRAAQEQQTRVAKHGDLPPSHTAWLAAAVTASSKAAVHKRLLQRVSAGAGPRL